MGFRFNPCAQIAAARRVHTCVAGIVQIASYWLTFRTDVYAQESLWFTSTGNLNPNTELPGYGLVNFRIGLQDEAAGWSVSANLKNAFDKVYWVGGWRGEQPLIIW